MKKLFLLAAAAALTVCLSACGGGDIKPETEPENTPAAEAPAEELPEAQEPEETGVELPNPMLASDPAEILETVGVTFIVPEGATDVLYYAISGELAQMNFDLNGVECMTRIMPALELNDISGMYYDWTTKDTCQIGWCDGEYGCIDGEQGYCAWYDAAPGLLYCVSMNTGATRNGLLSLAEACYIPVQGEVDGDIDIVIAEPLYVGVWYGDENAEKLLFSEIQLYSGFDANDLISALREAGVLDADSAANSLETHETEDGLMSAALDMNAAFAAHLRSMGTAGERIIIGSMVKTFCGAYKADQLKITVDGGVLETGHEIYDYYLPASEIDY